MLPNGIPAGLSFANGAFNETVTEPVGVYPLLFLATDSQGYTLAAKTYMQVSEHPSWYVLPQSSSSSSNSLAPIVGAAAGGGLFVLIIVAFVIFRSRRDTSVNGIMMVRNPMFLPMAAMEEDVDTDADFGAIGGIITPEAAARLSVMMTPLDYMAVGTDVDDDIDMPATTKGAGAKMAAASQFQAVDEDEMSVHSEDIGMPTQLDNAGEEEDDDGLPSLPGMMAGVDDGDDDTFSEEVEFPTLGGGEARSEQLLAGNASEVYLDE
jgi:hypothetical protein